jgi:hypothetical protein
MLNTSEDQFWPAKFNGRISTGSPMSRQRMRSYFNPANSNEVDALAGAIGWIQGKGCL